ncbi:hypothetical protein Tco_1075930, partial [Tanacetum coccineum]
DDGLRGLSVVTRELPLIDMGELVKLNICMEIGDDWAWVAQGAERQQVVMAAAPKGAEDALDVDEGAQAIPTPIHAPPPPPQLQDLAAKKSMKLVKYRSSGILCVIVVMLEYKRIYNTHPCS